MVSKAKLKELASLKQLLILRFSQLLDARIYTVCRAFDLSEYSIDTFNEDFFILYYKNLGSLGMGSLGIKKLIIFIK